VVKLPAEALKVAVAAPARTLTEAGTVTVVLLDANATVAVDTAAWLKDTVHVLVAPEFRLAGAH
jgi:hypothetical protein